ncbi:hypothetical protein NDI76_17240 [Halogeometricum sp. S1BR25-6]|uniref:GGDEF domain-containing protein n=1 Tax=Halogeometricum salsisoli TaxID=2950536 RepID=A0ABU2GI76_9EURY|nr:hypothetical protein [Halogeometricum sp. S1BR25-6]MDS0300496.1 hypothetical protein [Halogeometricum sp. S1BR25-6]
MSLMLNAARLAAAVNIVLLATLLTIWIRNYREIRAPLTLGSIVFGSLLLVENAVALYFYLSPPAMPALAVRFMMVLQVLETVAIAVLAYVIWQ